MASVPSLFDYLRCLVDLKFGSDWINNKRLFTNTLDVEKHNQQLKIDLNHTTKTVILFHNTNPNRFLYVSKYIFGRSEKTGLPWFKDYLPMMVHLGIFPSRENDYKFLHNDLFIQDFEHENGVVLFSDFVYRHIYDSKFIINFMESILSLLNTYFLLICPSTDILLVDTTHETLLMPSYNYCMNIFQPISEKLIKVCDPLFIHPFNSSLKQKKHNGKDTDKKTHVSTLICSRLVPLQTKKKSSTLIDKYSILRLKEYILNMVYLLSLISVFWRLNFDHSSSISRLLLGNVKKLVYFRRSPRNNKNYNSCCFCSNIFQSVTINIDLELRSLIHDYICVHVVCNFPKILSSCPSSPSLRGEETFGTKYREYLLGVYKTELMELKTFCMKLDFLST